jgi:site-specific recombinase XerD
MNLPSVIPPAPAQLIPRRNVSAGDVALASVPALVAEAGPVACRVWDDFFAASLRNAHTRAAYCRAVRCFLAWMEQEYPGVPLHEITPAQVGTYFDQHPGGPPTRKLHLAALRRLFDLFVTRHLMVLNPAACVRGERYQVVEGKTPEITAEQARRLIASIPISRRLEAKPILGLPPMETTVPLVVGLRDKAALGVMLFTAARAGAIAKLRLKHLRHDGSQWTLRFEEKGGKSREIPVRHDLERLLHEYIEAAGLADAAGGTPLFRSAWRTSGQLTDKPMTGVDLCRMVKRRLKDAGLPTHLSPHSFRVFTVTDLLSQGISLESVQYLAGHSDPRTTRLYDRRQQRVSRQIVERISITIEEPGVLSP